MESISHIHFVYLHVEEVYEKLQYKIFRNNLNT
jgi:hypothetical protein